MEKIEVVYAREILDSRGNPTVEVEVGLSGVNPNGHNQHIHGEGGI
jgi:enolase